MRLQQIAFASVSLLASMCCGTAQAQTADDRRAAYCMEASFGTIQQHNRLIAVLRSNRDSLESIAEKFPGSKTERDAFVIKTKSDLTKSIEGSEAKRDRVKADLDVYLAYLKRRKIIDGPGADLSLIKEMTSKVGDDQVATRGIYRACLKACQPQSAACKAECDTKATMSEPSKRMLRCSEIVDQFK